MNKEEFDKIKEKYLADSKKMQKITLIITSAFILIAFCPGILVFIIPACLLSLFLFFIRILWALIKRFYNKIKGSTTKKISLIPWWAKNFYIAVLGFVLAVIEVYKKDWYKNTILLLVAIIAICLMKIAF